MLYLNKYSSYVNTSVPLVQQPNGWILADQLASQTISTKIFHLLSFIS